MKEATTLKFELVEHAKEEVVDLFVTWVYSRSLPGYDWKSLKRDAKYASDKNSDTLILAWRLGDYLQSIEFKNDVLRLIHEALASGPTLSHPFIRTPLLVADLNTSSSLFRLLTDIIVKNLYTMDERQHIKQRLAKLEGNMRDVVMEYMAIYGAHLLGMFQEFQPKVARYTKNPGSVPELKAQVLDRGVERIKNGANGVEVETYFERVG